MSNVVFVTGNPKKAANFSRFMGLEIDHHAADIDEIQTLNPRELVEHKARQAYTQLKTPVLVEDVTFTFRAWGDLPGPFVKFFVKNNSGDGVQAMCRMLDGFDDRGASACCTYGYFDGERMEFFEGNVEGEVANSPRGTNGYGFDRLFEPNLFENKTAAELTEEEYETYYTSLKPFSKVRAFLQKEGLA